VSSDLDSLIVGQVDVFDEQICVVVEIEKETPSYKRNIVRDESGGMYTITNSQQGERRRRTSNDSEGCASGVLLYVRIKIPPPPTYFSDDKPITAVADFLPAGAAGGLLFLTF
jgi:hypothetical protein